MLARRLAAILLALSTLPVLAQSSVAPKEDLAGLAPIESVFYVEHAGHDAVKDVFDASNLGEMYKDPAMNRFVNEMRVLAGQLIVKGMFDLQGDEAINKHRELLHDLLKPFWYKPAAWFVLPTKDMSTPLGPIASSGFICAIPKADRKEPQAALDALKKVGVPESGAGTRQAFDYTSGNLTWSGVAKGSEEFTIPTEAGKLKDALKDKCLFMTCWTEKYLLVATSLEAADALEKGLFDPKERLRSKAPGLSGTAGFKTVMKKTELKDWAFRWYFNVLALEKYFGKEGFDKGRQQLATLGLEKIEALGGSGGYDKKVFVRRTFILSPKTDAGLLRLFKAGGSYKSAFAMMPPNCTFVLSGKIDPDTVSKLFLQMVRRANNTPDADNNKAVSAQQRKVLKVVNTLVAASSGDVGVYVGKIDLAAMMSEHGGPPMGLVIGIKDKESGQKVLADILDVAGVKAQSQPATAPATEAAETEDADDDAPKPTPAPAAPDDRVPKTYRDVSITSIEQGGLLVALMDDRIIFSYTPRGLRLAIDAARDKNGGFAKDPKGAKYLEVAGDGAGVAYMDLGLIAKAFWPQLLQARDMASMDKAAANSPLKSIPETEVLTKYLGPEVIVIENDPDGVLLKSAGLVPLVTKIVPAYTGIGVMMFYALCSPVEAAPPMPPAGAP